MFSGKLVLNRGDPEWWSFYDINATDAHGCGKSCGPMAIIVSEETPRKLYSNSILEVQDISSLSRFLPFACLFVSEGIIGDTLSNFSIWGLYLTFVLAVGRFIRLQCADLRMRIPYENLPYCDRSLDSCTFSCKYLT